MHILESSKSSSAKTGFFGIFFVGFRFFRFFFNTDVGVGFGFLKYRDIGFGFWLPTRLYWSGGKRCALSCMQGIAWYFFLDSLITYKNYL